MVVVPLGLLAESQGQLGEEQQHGAPHPRRVTGEGPHIDRHGRLRATSRFTVGGGHESEDSARLGTGVLKVFWGKRREQEGLSATQLNN